MDIRKAELDQLERMMKDWLEHPSQELEATFGIKGQVNSTTFAAIGKRQNIHGRLVQPGSGRQGVFGHD